MFLRRLINWVSGWGGSLGTASGTQLGQPDAPIVPATNEITADGSLQISTVYACVEILAQTISSLPLFVYREKPNGARVKDRGGRLYQLLHDSPNAWMTPSDLIATMVVNRLLRGNAYALIERDPRGNPIALVPLSADQMEVSVVGGKEAFTYYMDGRINVYAPENIVHWKGMGNGSIGLSKLQYMRASINEAINAQTNATRLYGSGSKPSGILSVDAKLDDEQISEILSRFRGMASGNGSGLYIVDRGLKYSQLSIDPQDAQLLESRKFSAEEICRWFGVPGVLVGLTGQTGWGSGISELVSGFHKFTIGPLCTQLEQAFEKKLKREADITIEFSTDALLRTDPASRANFYAQMAQNGAMTRNEIRRLENMEPVEGGDALTAQSNLVPIEMLGKVKTNSSAPTTEPVRQ